MAETIRDAVIRVQTEFAKPSAGPDLSAARAAFDDLREHSVATLNAIDADLRDFGEGGGFELDTSGFEKFEAAGKTAVEDVRATLAKVPPVEITLDDAAARADVADLADRIDALRGREVPVTLTVEDSGAGELEREVEAVTEGLQKLSAAWDETAKKGGQSFEDAQAEAKELETRLESATKEFAALKAAGGDFDKSIVESFEKAGAAAQQFEQQTEQTRKGLEEIGRSAVDEGIKASEGLTSAAEGALTFARGLTFLGVTSESELAKVVENLALIQGGIDLVKGGQEVVKGLVEGYRAFSVAAKAAAGAQLGMTAALGPLAIAGAAAAAAFVLLRDETEDALGAFNEAAKSGDIATLTDALADLEAVGSRISTAFSDPLFNFQVDEGLFDEADEFETRIEQITEAAARLNKEASAAVAETFEASFAGLETFTGEGLANLKLAFADLRDELAGGLLGTESAVARLFPTEEELKRLGEGSAAAWVEAFTKQVEITAGEADVEFDFSGMATVSFQHIDISFEELLQRIRDESDAAGIQDAVLKSILPNADDVSAGAKEAADNILKAFETIKDINPAASLKDIPTILNAANQLTADLTDALAEGNLTAEKRKEIIDSHAAKLETTLGFEVDIEASLKAQVAFARTSFEQTKAILEAHRAIEQSLKNQLQTEEQKTLELGHQFEALVNSKADFLEGLGKLDAEERKAVQSLLTQAATEGVETLTDAQAKRLEALGAEAGGQIADAANAVIGRRLALTVDPAQADALIETLQDLDIVLKARFDTDLIEGDLEAALAEVQAAALADPMKIPVEFVPGETEGFFRQFQDAQAELLDQIKKQSQTQTAVNQERDQIQAILEQTKATRELLEQQAKDAAAAAGAAGGSPLVDGIVDMADATAATGRAMLQAMEDFAEEQSDIQRELARIRDDAERGRGV